jgi:ketosteroid isomerase-like protein
MHSFRTIASVACLFAVSACASTPSVESDRAALADANRKYDAALINADAAALRELYADDFRYFGPNHVVRDRATQIEALTSGAVDLIFGKSSDVEIRLYGPTAVLTGRFEGRVSVSGREFAFSERYSTVWVKQRNRWRMVLEHGSVIEEGS